MPPRPTVTVEDYRFSPRRTLHSCDKLTLH